MKPLFSLRKRVFLNPVSTGQTSYILAEVESSRDGEYKWGHYMLTIADCRRHIQLEILSRHQNSAANQLETDKSFNRRAHPIPRSSD